jgi:hypothetical protein
MQAQTLITRLGGINEVAHQLMTPVERKQPSTVSRRRQMVRSWVRRNNIPPSWLLARANVFALPGKQRAKLCEELGHADVVAALRHMKRMQTALKVVRTWAAFPPLDASEVQALCDRALNLNERA